MALTLITGPANAAKAGAVLQRVRAAAAAGRDPVLVVPNRADVAEYLRELGGDPTTVLGARVVVFDGLVQLVAGRAGVVDRPLGALQREAVIAGVAARLSGRLGPLAAAAGTPGFAAAAAGGLGDLSASGQSTGRLIAALRAWGEESGRREWSEALVALVGGYRDALRDLGRPDAEAHALAAVQALAAEPARWGRAPVLLYGFDDLTAVQQAVVEALAGPAIDIDVVVSLPAEAGRVALAARAGLVADLAARAAEVVALDPAADELLGPEGEPTDPQLRAVERGLFTRGAPAAPAGDAVRLLEGGGERAERELVADEVARLLDGGMAPADVVVVVRGDEAVPPMLEVLTEAGVPAAGRHHAPFAATALGASLLALVRCAVDPAASAEDLVRLLRTPGWLDRPWLADTLEYELRRDAVADARTARRRWEDAHFPLGAVERVERAARRGTRVALIDAVEEEARLLFAHPWKAAGRQLDADGLDEAAALAAVGRWAAELRDLAAGPDGDALLPGRDGIAPALTGLVVARGQDPGPGVVAVLDPLRVRARRVGALVLSGLQDGVLPRVAPGDPLIDDDVRAGLMAQGIPLRPAPDALSDERFLFYATVSRPTRRLVVSWHAAEDDEGRARLRSPFVDDLADVLDPEITVRTRLLGEVAWSDGPPAGRLPAHRADVLAAGPHAPRPFGPLRDPAVLDALARHEAFSATALETLLDCPVKWFAERWLRGSELGLAAAPLVRGGLMHAVLEDALVALDGPLTPDRLPDAERLLDEALERHAERFPISPHAVSARAHVRRLRADLHVLLDHLACEEALAPAHVELSFGLGDDTPPAVEIDPGIRLTGRIDRVDITRDGSAVIVDYKSSANGSPGHAAWIETHKVQAVLYLLAARRLLALDVAGALYQPARPKFTARGVLRAGTVAGVPTDDEDVLPVVEFDRLLTDVLAAVRDAVARLRTGDLTPQPATCAYRGGCAHPALCRIEDAPGDA